MATRAAIAARDRDSKERIAKQDRAEKKRQFDKSYGLEREMQTYNKMKAASEVTKNLSQAAYGKGGLAGAMSSGSNDPKWYKKFELNKYSVNLPTFYRLGQELKHQWLTNDSYDTVPGILVFNYIPTLPNQWPVNVSGNTAYKTSPINLALTRFMAELRKLNSRIGDYDPADIGLYWYAIVGVINDISRVCKAIKAYNTYYSSNKYLSRAFIESCGFDTEDFFHNVQQYKATVMRWISIFNANAVIPNSLDLIKRYFWLANVVVRDHKGDQSQLYHFNCPYSIHLTSDETYVSISQMSNGYTYATYFTRVDSEIQELFNSVGVVTMTADLRAAFPSDKTLKYPEMTGTETLEYSESMHDLEQIHNLRTLPYIDPDPTDIDDVPTLSRMNIIVSSDGYLAQGAFSSGNLLPIVYSRNSMLTNERMLSTVAGSNNSWLNFYDSEFISDDSILEATRLRFILHAYNATFNGYTLKINGTELITHGIMYQAYNNDDSVTQETFFTEVDLVNNYTVNVAQFRALCSYSTFDWIPNVRYVCEDDAPFIYTVGEVDHAVYISDDNLKIIHEGCALSLFFVDDFAKSIVR